MSGFNYIEFSREIIRWGEDHGINITGAIHLDWGGTTSLCDSIGRTFGVASNPNPDFFLAFPKKAAGRADTVDNHRG